MFSLPEHAPFDLSCLPAMLWRPISLGDGTASRPTTMARRTRQFCWEIHIKLGLTSQSGLDGTDSIHGYDKCLEANLQSLEVAFDIPPSGVVHTISIMH